MYKAWEGFRKPFVLGETQGSSCYRSTTVSSAKLLWTQPLQDRTPTYVMLFLPTKDLSTTFMELHLTVKGKNKDMA